MCVASLGLVAAGAHSTHNLAMSGQGRAQLGGWASTSHGAVQQRCAAAALDVSCACRSPQCGKGRRQGCPLQALPLTQHHTYSRPPHTLLARLAEANASGFSSTAPFAGTQQGSPHILLGRLAEAPPRIVPNLHLLLHNLRGIGRDMVRLCVCGKDVARRRRRQLLGAYQECHPCDERATQAQACRVLPLQVVSADYAIMPASHLHHILVP